MSCNPFEPGQAMASMLRRDFRGPVHLTRDGSYGAARATWAAGIDQLPAVVAEALDPLDVRAAILAARTHDMPLAVQSTGHGTYVPCQAGLLLRTSRMDGVEIDPGRRIARVGAGTRWDKVIAAAAPYGLAPPSGSHATVGVAGYTLGGDLFLALRGAGRNFGAVTALEIRLAPVAHVYGGTAAFPIARARELLAAFRELAPHHPDELTVRVVLSRNGPGGQPVVGLRSVYLGGAEEGRRRLEPLLEAAGTPLSWSYRKMRYADTDGVGSTPPDQFALFAVLPDHLVTTAVARVTRSGSEVEEIEIRHWGGATACAMDPGPVGHRAVPFSMTIAGSTLATGSLTAHATGGSFLNFSRDMSRTESAYTPADLARLRTLKRRCDPDNVFGRHSQLCPGHPLRVSRPHVPFPLSRSTQRSRSASWGHRGGRRAK